MASLLDPLTLQRSGQQLSSPKWLLWKGPAAREEAPIVPASTRCRSGAKASAQATAALLARPPGTVNCAVTPAGGQLLTLESDSTSRHFLLLVSAPYCPLLDLRHRTDPGSQ